MTFRDIINWEESQEGFLEMFYILTLVVIKQMYTYSKINWATHLRFVHFTIWNLYLKIPPPISYSLQPPHYLSTSWPWLSKDLFVLTVSISMPYPIHASVNSHLASPSPSTHHTVLPKVSQWYHSVPQNLGDICLHLTWPLKIIKHCWPHLPF